MKLNEIYSRVQLDLDDLSFHKIVKGDYFNFAQSVLNDFSKEALLWIETATIPAVNSATITYTHPTEMLNIEHISYLGRSLREISLNAILTARADRYNRAFTVNETEVDYGFYASTIDGTSLTLFFPYALTNGNNITVTLMVAAPSVAFELRPTDDFDVPVYMQNALRAGIYYNAIRTLMPREPGKWGSLYPLAKDEYDRELRRLSSYVINLKARNSFPQIQPIRFLP